RRELTMVGAASGAVAATPGLGTSAAASALVADLGWFATRATDLIMTIGAVHGYTNSTLEERRAWVLSVLAFGEEAADQFVSLVDEFGSGGAGSVIGGERVSARLAGLAGGDAATLDALRRINTSLATSLISRYGSRRSLLAVGKLLPFGVGAAVGASANYGLIRVVGSQSGRFFDVYRVLRPVSGTAPGLPQPPAPPVRPDGAPLPNPDAVRGAPPPPPAPGSVRLPNPPADLSATDRRRAIPTRTTDRDG
ncbi:MAG: hypothetical protein AAF547_25455, partial [Actinomycetota bacterium]